MTVITRYLLSLPKELKETLQEIAGSKGHTLNALVLIILRDWLDRQN